ncbi:type II secretion system protein [Polaromonas jejuensis]|uniref:Type II secretion system protein n=1 Tax=Polaromonas jejuensis TaxID=457502 RepID=A0ABW0QAX5_9BURK|nr:type II secretion system protein [Polaromonas jejuensis]
MLLALLIFLAILGLVVTKTAEVWSTTLTREREQELLFAGEQYRAAIERYYYATPGANKMLPTTLEELVKDDRFPEPQHHLRQLYPDPLREGEPWGVLRQGSRIVGVYSLSDQKPMKKSGFDAKYSAFSAAQSYRGWRFMFVPSAGGGGSLRAPNASQPGATAPNKLVTPSTLTKP